VKRAATIRPAQAAGSHSERVFDLSGQREKSHALPLPAPKKSLYVLPDASDSSDSHASNTSNCSREFYSISELARRWCVSRGAVYTYLRGYPVIDFAQAPGRRGHKIVSAHVVRQIERERERILR